ncbi:hypothetical protein SAMN04487767_106184, partial [Bacillus wiedmannii]
TPPQSGTTPSPAKPMGSKPITPPQSGTTPSQPTKNVPKVDNQQQVKEGAAIKKVETKAQTQQEALKNVKAKETIKPK